MVNSTTNANVNSQELNNEKKSVPKKVPAPIPDVNVWDLKKQSVPIAPVNNNTNDASWPEPKEAIQQEEQVNEKKPVSNTKTVGKGSWKPYTPTIIHASSPSGGRRNNNHSHRGRAGKNNTISKRPTRNNNNNNNEQVSPEISTSTSSLPTPSATTSTPVPTSTPTTPTTPTEPDTKLFTKPLSAVPDTTTMESNHQHRQYVNGRGMRRGGGGRGSSVSRYPRFFTTSPNPSAYFNLDPETLKSYICQQIEYYFSIDNLCKDLYLRSQMDTEGYVPLTLIAGFNRVRGLTSDMSLVRDSLELSKILEYIKEKDILRKKEGWETWILPAKKIPDGLPVGS